MFFSMGQTKRVEKISHRPPKLTSESSGAALPREAHRDATFAINRLLDVGVHEQL